MEGIHISIGNEKLRKTAKKNGVKVGSFDLPAGITCPCALECKAYCYADKGRFTFEGKRRCNADNLKASKSADFVQRMVAVLRNMDAHTRRNTYIRLHASGDFYSPEYAQKWADIASQCPSITFYAYTKSVKIVTGVKWPSNVHFAFSTGGKQDLLIPEGATVAKVFETDDDARKEGYDPSVNDDDFAVIRGGKLGLRKH